MITSRVQRGNAMTFCEQISDAIGQSTQARGSAAHSTEAASDAYSDVPTDVLQKASVPELDDVAA